MIIFTPVPGILGVGNQRCQSWDASRTHRHQSWILKLVILMLSYLQLNMVDRTRTTFIKWLMRNYSSWAWIHLFFVEFVVPSVVHLAPFPPTEKTISVWIWEQLSHWLPYSQIVCRVLDDSEDLKILRLQIWVSPPSPLLYCTLYCTVAKGLPSWALKVCAGKYLWPTMATAAVAESYTSKPNTEEGSPSFWCTEELRKAVFVAPW